MSCRHKTNRETDSLTLRLPAPRQNHRSRANHMMSPFHARRGSRDGNYGDSSRRSQCSVDPPRRRFHRDLYLPRDFAASSRDTRLLLSHELARELASISHVCVRGKREPRFNQRDNLTLRYFPVSAIRGEFTCIFIHVYGAVSPHFRSQVASEKMERSSREKRVGGCRRLARVIPYFCH